MPLGYKPGEKDLHVARPAPRNWNCTNERMAFIPLGNHQGNQGPGTRQTGPEHIPDPLPVLRALHGLLAPGGCLAVKVPCGTGQLRKERMRRLMSVVRAARLPFRELVTHSFDLAHLGDAYELFAHQRDGVMKVAVRA